ELMAKDPAARPASSVKVVQALETIAAGHSPAALTLHHSVAGKPARPSARRLRPAWLIAGLSGAAALLLLFFFGPLSAIFRGKEKPLRPIFRGVSENQILLGMSAPFSGPARELGRDMQVGIETYIEHVNDQGGIAGRKIRLVALDDGY